jgi:hypothetical protein
MGKIIIVPSGDWQAALYSSRRSGYTMGPLLISTGREATFTRGASAPTIMISLTRDTASQCSSIRVCRVAALGVQPATHSDPKALTTTIGVPEKSELGAQHSDLADSVSGTNQSKALPQKDKIELTIDSLPNYELLRPIKVMIEPLGDTVLVGEAPELNISTTGSSVGGVLVLLKNQISSVYEGLRSRKNLDSERAREFKILETYIGRPRRNWM